MRNLLFAVGSLGVAIGATLLALALLASVLLGRELSGTEKVISYAVACVVGGAWWAAVQSKLRLRREGGGGR